MLDAGLIVSRFVHFAAVLALFGASLFPIYAYEGHLDDGSKRLLDRLRPVLAGAAALAIASGLGWFAFTCAAMSGSLAGAFDPQVLTTIVRATDFGPLWLARLALAVMLFGYVLARPPARRREWTLPVLAGLLLASFAGTGHARAGEGLAGAIHVIADVAHLIAAGVWLGGLWPLAAALAWAHAGEDRRAHAAAELLSRFSGVGYVAVAVLVGSGLVNSWYLVGSVGALAGTTYGRLLSVKIALFLFMAMLAGANRFWITPGLHAAKIGTETLWLRRIRRHVAAEMALGLLVIALVSLFGTLQPAIEG